MDNFSAENLKICHANYQSLLARLDEFQDYFTNSEYHVICLLETWLKPQVSDDLISLQSYCLLRCDRKVGGGMALYVADFLPA